MSAISWVETLVSSQSDGPALTTNATSKSMLNADGLYTFPPNYFGTREQTLRINFSGRASLTAVTGPGNSIQVKLGSTTILGAVFKTTNPGAVSNVPFWGEILLSVRVIGTVAQTIGVGQLWGIDAAATTSNLLGILSANPPALGTAFDATVAKTLDFFMTIGTTEITSIQLHQYSLEALH